MTITKTYMYTYNLSVPKRFTLDVPNQSPPYSGIGGIGIGVLVEGVLHCVVPEVSLFRYWWYILCHTVSVYIQVL